MTNRITIDGLDRLLSTLDPQRQDDILHRLLTRATAIVLARTKEAGPRTARRRPIRYGGGRVSRDMTSGRYTPVLTGNLRRSITSEVQRSEQRGIVGTNVVYGRYVHKHRPFLVWALEDSQDKIAAEIDKAGQALVGDA
jgi:phage gpG-like protein